MSPNGQIPRWSRTHLLKSAHGTVSVIFLRGNCNRECAGPPKDARVEAIFFMLLEKVAGKPEARPSNALFLPPHTTPSSPPSFHQNPPSTHPPLDKIINGTTEGAQRGEPVMSWVLEVPISTLLVQSATSFSSDKPATCFGAVLATCQLHPSLSPLGRVRAGP